MTRRELNLAVFTGTADRPLWQPRLEEWYHYNQVRGTLPAEYRDLDLLEVYDRLRCSVRYAASAGLERYHEPGALEVSEEDLDDTHRAVHYRSAHGRITTVRQLVRENGRVVNDRIRDFPVKTPDDLRVVIDLVEDVRCRADVAAFEAAAARMGDRGEPTVFFGGSGFTDLIKNWCGLPGTYYLLTDARAVVEEYLEACDRLDDRLMAAALELPCRLFNFGDHATNEFTPPPILKRYLLPRWQRLSAVLTAHGRFCHTHWDGNSRTMLPYLQESGVHGVEALPPWPMGDMTLEEIKQAVGDNLVVLDLLPTTHFLPHYTLEECLEFARRIMDLFTPRLILGVSDEISGVGDIRRIEAISELVDREYGLAD